MMFGAYWAKVEDVANVEVETAKRSGSWYIVCDSLRIESLETDVASLQRIVAGLEARVQVMEAGG